MLKIFQFLSSVQSNYTDDEETIILIDHVRNGFGALRLGG